MMKTGKNSNNGKLKYCLYASGEWLKQSYQLSHQLHEPISHNELPTIIHSGLTNWARVFDGVYTVPRSLNDLRQYDVVHVNMTTKNIGVIGKLRKWCDLLDDNDKPQIVVNPDYAVEMWENYQRFDLFLNDIQKADHIFCVEQTMSNTLECLLGRKVWHIPHPTNVKQLQKMKKQKFDTPTVMVLAHNYDQNYLLPTYAVDSVLGVVKVLVGHMEKAKPFVRTVYDEVHTALPFDALMDIVAQCHCVIDTAVTHSYGRIGVECAAVGTHCIGQTESCMKLHPDMISSVFNVKTLQERILKAIQNPTVISEPEIYGYDSSRKQFMSMLGGV